MESAVLGSTDGGPPRDPPVEAMATDPLDGECAQLRDGTRVRIRRAGPGDQARVMDFLARLSQDSLELRYFSAIRREKVASEILATGDRGDRLSLLLETISPDPGQVVAHGEYVRIAAFPHRAEVAFLVADARQGQGAATLLLWGLARRARDAGIRRFEAVVLPDNRPMINVFVGAGFPCSISWHEGEGLVLLDISHEPAISIALRDPAVVGPVGPT